MHFRDGNITDSSHFTLPRINAYSFQIGYFRQRLNDGIGGDTAQTARESIVDLSGRLDVALAEIENMG